MSLLDQVETMQGLMRSLNRGHIDRREFLTLCGSLSAAAIVAGCSIGSTSAGSSPKSGQTVIPLYVDDNDPASLAYFVSVITAWVKNHPNNQIPLSIYDDGTAPQFLQTSFRSGRDLGVFTPPPSFVPAYAQAGQLLAIDDVIASVGPDDFVPGGRMIVNGHDYSFPFQANATGLWYRKDVFQKLGISAPLSTFDDLISTLKEVNGRNGMIGIATGVGGDTPDIALHSLTPYIEQQGWGYFDKNGNVTFGQEAVFQGVQNFLQVMSHTDKSMFNVTYSDWVNAYISGRAVMCHYPGRVGNNIAANAPQLEDITGFMPEPGGPFMTGLINRSGPRGYSVYAHTADPEGAKQFLQFLFTGENALAWSLTLPGQVLPALKSVSALFDDPNNAQIKANAYVQKHADWIKTMIQLVPTNMDEQIQMGTVNNSQFTKIGNPNPMGSQIWKNPAIDATMIQQVGLNGMDPRAAWTAAVNQLNAVHDAFFKQNPNWKPPV